MNIGIVDIRNIPYPTNLLRDAGVIAESSEFVTYTEDFDARLRKVFASRNPREPAILIGYYRDMKTFRELGISLGVTGSRASQLKYNALQYLKQNAGMLKYSVSYVATKPSPVVLFNRYLEKGGLVQREHVLNILGILAQRGIIIPDSSSKAYNLTKYLSLDILPRLVNVKGLHLVSLISLSRFSWKPAVTYALVSYDVYTVGDMLLMSGAEFAQLKGIGVVAKSGIISQMKEFGFNVAHLFDMTNTLSPYSMVSPELGYLKLKAAIYSR